MVRVSPTERAKQRQTLFSECLEYPGCNDCIADAARCKRNKKAYPMWAAVARFDHTTNRYLEETIVVSLRLLESFGSRMTRETVRIE